MNPYANLRFARRLPHSGWAGSGPHIDKRARLAERILIGIVIVFSVLFAAGVL